MLHIKREMIKHLETGFSEDIGFGDISSAILPEDNFVEGSFISKDDGVLAGVHAISIGYQMLDDAVQVTKLRNDGDAIKAGDSIATISGPARSVLSGERVILNIVQHLCGIATKTAVAVKSVAGSGIRICDTRKTLPGYRSLQKYAVRCGGGFNHRMRLDDGVMIKDNHIAAAGSITKAVEAARSSVGLMVKVEVECETDAQVKEAVKAGADIIMLDNKTPDQAAELIKLIPDSIIIELSGGITAETAGRYKNCGADYISLGSLTHSVAALDISFVLNNAIK